MTSDLAGPWAEAEAYLQQQDPRLGAVIQRHGPCTLEPGESGFATLADSIIGQQISNKVAKVLRTRFRSLFPNEFPTPEPLLALEDEVLRNVGLSRSKVRYLRALADAFSSGGLTTEALHRLSDEDLVTALTEVKGIGRWTAEMYLIFALNRPDVLPLGDAAIGAAFRRLYDFPETGWQSHARQQAAAWQPWRTVGCWYLWKEHSAPDGVPAEPASL